MLLKLNEYLRCTDLGMEVLNHRCHLRSKNQSQRRRRIMKMGLKRYGPIALLAMVALTLAPQAFATAQLSISDGTNSVLITDNGGVGTCVGVAAADCVDK